MREERKKVQKVVNTPVKTVKKGVVERLVLHMIGPDGIRAIGRQLGHEIIVPAIKNVLADSITSGTRMALFGERDGQTGGYRGGYTGGSYRNYQGSSSSPSANRYNYAQSYQGVNHQGQGTMAPRNQSFKNSIPVYFMDSRKEAEDVIGALLELIDDYGVASLNDYYDLIGVDGSYADFQWGWRNLDVARIMVGTDGFFIEFPKLEKVQ